MMAAIIDPWLTAAVGWSLIHFLWQGAVLAFLLYVFLLCTTNQRWRYAGTVAALGAMLFTPVVTFFILLAKPQQSSSPAAKLFTSPIIAAAQKTGAFHPASPSISPADWSNYVILAWLLGMALFALRAVGGCLLLRQLLHEKCWPLSPDLRDRCLHLQKRLRLRQSVRYCLSGLVATPSVVGWFRPVILLPLSAVSGLSLAQLEAIVAHELAHIRRLDSFVNVFQIATETVLFYHPAVWWVSRTVRQERENCCDDVAVQICGNPGDYARALALLASLRHGPELALAATGGSLKNRIARILGFQSAPFGLRQGALAIGGSLCLAAALFGVASFSHVLAQEASAVKSADPSSADATAVPPAAPAHPVRGFKIAPPEPSSDVPAPVPPPSPASVEAQNPARVVTSERSGSYIADLQSAGLKDLTVDNLLALKVQGVTPDYVRDIRAPGLSPSVHELIAMRVQGISPDYVKYFRSSGWAGVTIENLIALKVQGVDPAQATALRQELGSAELPLNQLIALKVQGVTPGYVRELRAAGLKSLSSSEVIAAKVQGITPEFVQTTRSRGFPNLSLGQLIRLKQAGVF